MITTFLYNGTSYSNWDTESEEFKRLNIPESEKAKIITDAQMFTISQKRKIAYQKEADPLYLEWQYDQTAEKEQIWRAQVAEIKARYPLPSEN